MSAITYSCDTCGAAFPTRQALGGHVSAAHRDNRRSAVKTLADELENARREVVAEFRPRIAEIDREIAKTERRALDLKTERKEIEAQLRRLDPDATMPGPKGPRTPRQSFQDTPSDRMKLDVTRKFLSEHADDLGPFTGESLRKTMIDAKVEPPMSGDKMRVMLPILQEEGVVRAHRVVKGGGLAYAVVGGASDRNGDES